MADLRGEIHVGAARVAGIYLVLAITWIILTDLGALQFVFDRVTLTSVQTAKGVVFVTASAGLLYVLIAREQRRLESTNEELELTLRHASVLHRLLRHNLRNSCDVIMNNVALLRRNRVDEDEAYDRIDRQTTTLVDIAEKSRHLRELVLSDDPERQSIDLARVVRNRAARVRADFPGAEIDVETPEEAMAVAHPRIGVGIDEILRNGVVHSGRDDPTVRATVAVEDDAVEVTIEDDGPGLPEHEVTSLSDTYEEPLEHSRGIGLWLVQFLLEKSGGTIETEPANPGGTVVRMEFDRAP